MYDDVIEEVRAADSHKQNLKRKIEDIDKKIPDTCKFIESQKFNKLTKINLMQEYWKLQKHCS